MSRSYRKHLHQPRVPYLFSKKRKLWEAINRCPEMVYLPLLSPEAPAPVWKPEG